MCDSPLNRRRSTRKTVAKKMLNNAGDNTHPWRNPCSMLNLSEQSPLSFRAPVPIPSWNWRISSIIRRGTRSGRVSAREGNTHRHTKPLPTYLTSGTFKSAATEGGRLISLCKGKNEGKTPQETEKSKQVTVVSVHYVGLPYSVTLVDIGFSRYLAVLFSLRVLDFSSSSFLHFVITSALPR